MSDIHGIILIELLCVCDEEWCFCTNKVAVTVALPAPPQPPEVACSQCAAGHHVWTPEGPRS